MKEISDSEYTPIIPTAFATAYPRTLSDIPYSDVIFEQLLRLRKEENLPELETGLIVPRLAPELEARYKLVDKLLRQTGITQVLELAAGLSPRGLIMAGGDPTVQYAELELLDMIAMKRRILGDIAELPENLHLIAGNALRLKDLRQATADFDVAMPLAIVNEGLLRYLNFDEKAQIARNVHAVLELFGGAWITCDTTPKKFLAVQDSVTKPGMNDRLSKTSGKDFNNTMFEDLNHAKRFFGELGFSLEVHELQDIATMLSSPAKLHLARDETARLLAHGVVVVMQLR
ncbi:MAG TPA: class I SAM-dependent methyltransferase [Candidatus Saccharimonadales bacterium]|jgi:O-methyltransferase involved in polyketide biosynthesis